MPLQPDQIEQKLAPKINHPSPGIFYVPRCRLLEHALVDVVRDLIAQIVFHLGLNALLIQDVDGSNIHPIAAKKFAMALVKLPERLIGTLTIDAELRSEFQAVGERIIPSRPNRAALRARRDSQIIK